jgi:hypothetical protein
VVDLELIDQSHLWGLRPQTPYTLSRGGPSLPAPFA